MSARRTPRWPLLAAGVVLAFVACEPAPTPPRFYVEDFEELCDGTPCRWERTTGNADQATWVETIHPGEHGLRLVGDVSVRGPGSIASDAIAPEALFLNVHARCDAGAELRVDVIFADEIGAPFEASTIVRPAAGWEAPAIQDLVIDSGATRVNATRVVAVGIAKSGAGACEISELVIDDAVLTPGC